MTVKTFDITEHCAAMRARYHEQVAGRREDYLWLRTDQHETREQAAARASVSERTAFRYEAWRRGGLLPKAPPWSAEEIEMALRTDLPDRHISRLIGRSEGAIRQKRYQVRKAAAS